MVDRILASRRQAPAEVPPSKGVQQLPSGRSRLPSQRDDWLQVDFRLPLSAFEHLRPETKLRLKEQPVTFMKRSGYLQRKLLDRQFLYVRSETRIDGADRLLQPGAAGRRGQPAGYVYRIDAKDEKQFAMLGQRPSDGNEKLETVLSVNDLECAADDRGVVSFHGTPAQVVGVDQRKDGSFTVRLVSQERVPGVPGGAWMPDGYEYAVRIPKDGAHGALTGRVDVSQPEMTGTHNVLPPLFERPQKGSAFSIGGVLVFRKKIGDSTFFFVPHGNRFGKNPGGLVYAPEPLAIHERHSSANGWTCVGAGSKEDPAEAFGVDRRKVFPYRCELPLALMDQLRDLKPTDFPPLRAEAIGELLNALGEDAPLPKDLLGLVSGYRDQLHDEKNPTVPEPPSQT